MRVVVAALATLAIASPAVAAPEAGFAPLQFLAGHCWKGAFPDGKKTDEHCFAFDYGGRQQSGPTEQQRFSDSHGPHHRWAERWLAHLA